MFYRIFLVIFFGFTFSFAFAQQRNIEIRGIVKDTGNSAVPGVSVIVEASQHGTITREDGTFQLKVSDDVLSKNLVFSHIKYIEKRVLIRSFMEHDEPMVIILVDSIRLLDQVDVVEDRLDELDVKVSTYNLDPLQSQFSPAPFQDISGILITLPGVSSRNEFSTAYSVRGGNYDENLVYVNNIPVYRPQIVTSGQQEGLSFVNLDLVEGIQFSSGGWESKYGDGLASTLNIRYKKPVQFGGSLNLGLLGGSAHIEGITNDKKLTYLVGARLKASEYLLNTLETEGEYRPRFTDIQTYLNYDLSGKRKSGSTEIGVLFSYAKNRYLVEPTSRETTFGTFNTQLRLYVAFDGQEKLTFDTWQSAIRFSHQVSTKWKTHLIFSGTYSMEREYYDIESGYLLCNVDNNPTSAGFNKCLTSIGIGTNYFYGRNMLDATLVNVESRNEIVLDRVNTLEFGAAYAHHSFDDFFNEYEFIDSADYVTITDAVQSASNLNYSRIQAYVQNTSKINARHILTYGVRFLFQDTDKQALFSPRIQYSWDPGFSRNTYFRASAGVYRQPPLYREFRNNQGELNMNLKAQSSFHSIAGIDHNFFKWGRPFKFTTELYYKYLWDVNPYDIENVRIRYFAENIAKAYAAGVDFRLSGEFIPGDESWFSLGVLTTKEDIETDNRGYIPRPTDQRVNLAIFFQDHIPNLPSFRVHLRLLYSSGLPFSPPVNPENRNAFRGGEYQRVDIGFSKMFPLGVRKDNPFLKSLWLSAEILNLTSHQNTISYYWVNDVNNNYYAVPNSLSQRFFNLRGSLKF
jgi:hypothetical protein